MSKVWFITGAGSGIGAATVRAALKAGDRAVATGRNLAKLRRALRDVANDRLAFVSLDVSDEAQAKTAVQEAVGHFGRIDVLVNNAGYSMLGNFEELVTSDIERQFATNIFGVMHVLRAVLPIMRRQRTGRVINIGSLAGVTGFAHCGAYAATKFAVEGLSLSVAQEVEPFGIRITVVEPGAFRTGLLETGHAKYGLNTIEDYAGTGDVAQAWAALDGRQPGDPAKLGEALVRIANMADPPRQFLAGSDALAIVEPVLETRLHELNAHRGLSRSTDRMPDPHP
ncbi:SDR family oxidoreductase [Pseudothauera rhizosphaerae]|uniref:SDR family oxidoreductase n=1 Tax=Pseudothauera rhizosphaerae TaxID=2565932 RepID=A0A4S4ABZ9_9RHOO|nr:SDR family oxidoreductase [Pseudothauera rhizosphaerae]THF56537.1 SDR family oxidoreductase [Pseudothauera rhizosphaerae]